MQVKCFLDGASARPGKGIRVWLIERKVMGDPAAQSG
jgi:hypothetical protein